MSFDVLLSSDAERDIEDIYRYVARADAPAKADRLLDALQAACVALSDLPDRGNVPKELASLGIADFREIHHPPYRIIYRIMGRQVVIYCVLDGRRDMQALLQRRLIR